MIQQALFTAELEDGELEAEVLSQLRCGQMWFDLPTLTRYIAWYGSPSREPSEAQVEAALVRLLARGLVEHDAEGDGWRLGGKP